MKDFHLCGWLLRYDFSENIGQISHTSQAWHNFCKIFRNTVGRNFITYIHLLTKQNSFGSHLSLSFPIFYEPFHDGGHYYIETSPLICVANQWTGFYMITASVVKGLKALFRQTVFKNTLQKFNAPRI